jgi:hypothetical protein
MQLGESTDVELGIGEDQEVIAALADLEAEGDFLSSLSRLQKALNEKIEREGWSPFPIEEATVARKSIIVSDISGREIRDEKDLAKVAITYGDARRGRVELDVLASEVDDLAGKGKKTAKRGRKPKAAT